RVSDGLLDLSVTGLAEPLTLAPSFLFDGLLLHLIELVEADESLDFVSRGDTVVVAETAVFAPLLQLRQGLLGVMEADQQIKESIDGGLAAHISQLLRARGRTV